MKMQTAIIKPAKPDKVKEALPGIGIQGLHLAETKEFDCRREHAKPGRGAEHAVDLLPRMKNEIVLPADMVTPAVKVITNAARTEQSGDGRIFVTPVEQVIRIRTGETGKDAI